MNLNPFKIKQMPDLPVPLLALILVLLSFRAVNSQDDPYQRSNYYSRQQLYPNTDRKTEDHQQRQQVVVPSKLSRDDGNYQRSRYSSSYRENPLEKYNDKQHQQQVELKRLPAGNQQQVEVSKRLTAGNQQQQELSKPTSWIDRTSSFSFSQSTVNSRPKFNLTNEIEEISEDYDEKVVVRHTFDSRHPLERFGSSTNGGVGHPPVGDLLIGRKDRLSATSTCGVRKPERYCIVSHLAQRKKCFVCDQSEKFKNEKWKNHGIENIVTNLDENTKGFWWQAENGVENVAIQFDLEAEFHFTHLVIVFQTFRPAAMLIERSSDGGKTWKEYQFYAHNCTESFPHVKRGQRQRIDDVTCETQYSGVEPTKMGEIIFKVLPPNIHIDDPYSDQVQELLKMTNLRIRFTKLHTLGDNLLDPREEIKEKYYYAINNMVVRGSCSCYGHASRCIPEAGQSSVPGMVYGKCDCGHFTTGDNCNRCLDLYNDLEWKPAIGRQVNSCKRCECNNHATSCTFNRTVFELSGGVSGGVCNDCQHNTTGKNCQECAKFFYRNTALPITDPKVCEPCNCSPIGSLDEGVCDNRDDGKGGLVSGQCHCKEYADGPKCNVCKPGYWNLREDNPEGCEKCKCNTLGTIANRGCDQITGECACKPNVEGNDCNRCKPDYWGIDEGPEGCKPCNCDPGGSVLSQCDIRTGQCVCRRGVTGMRCEQPEPNHYAPFLDHLRIEAENTSSTSITKPLIREVTNPNEVTWTGSGFDVMHEGSSIEFEIKNTGLASEYDPVIRYESRFPRPLKARILVENVERPEFDIRDDLNMSCQPLPFGAKEQRMITLDPRERYAIAEKPPLCLLKDYTYKFRVELEPDTSIYRENTTILIDSVFLYPNIYNTPVLRGPENERKAAEFRHFQCEISQLTVRKNYLHEQCLKPLRSTSFYVYDGAYPCDCDTTGSLETQCNPMGGQCKCRPNVGGRRCDRCLPGYHSFGINGCEPCDCNQIKSLDNICSPSGQCACKPSAFGKRCDLCQPGFWNYPSCERCNCNRHAELCDSRSGKCIDCTENTDGHNCEKCKVGYYGNPTIVGYDIPCRACPCPGTPDSGIYHAQGCQLDPRTNGPICQCEKGYVGERCDRCDVNYYGNPASLDGECKRCDCNGNVDFSDIEVCDPINGRCKKCLYNTMGARCEECKPGFYGDALKQNCVQCVCNSMGTNMTDPENICDRKTGQCRCLPGVTGKECDTCEKDHWNLSSGRGCQLCNCDKSGSKYTQCNEFDGQCECVNGYGGKQCNECEKDYYGDPRKKCYPCNCVLPNSISTQCHKTNGTCVCAKGNAGPKCDQCARGYTGSPPYCESCGECFENWDQIIQGLKQHTNRLIESAKQINQTGLPGAYKDEFFEIESKLEEIDRIITGANISELDIKSIEDLVANLRQTLGEIERKLTEFTREIEKTAERLTDANLNLANLNNKVEELEVDMKKLRDNATALVEENVEGAYNLTKEAHRKSQSAKQTITNSAPILQQSEQLRKLTSKMLEDASVNYNENRVNNDGALSAIRRDIASLEKQIPEVNSLVCDGNSTVDHCESMCGGAGCGKCGGISCEKGATTIAGKALEMGKIAEEKLNESKEKALAELGRIVDSRNRVDEAYRQAQLAYDKVQNAKNSSDRMSSELKDLLLLIDKFLEESNAKPSAIRNLAEQCTALQISLKPDEIEKLAREINETISSLTDIEAILKETADDLGNANSLKERADQAKIKADKMLSTAKQVLGALDEAVNAQSRAEQSINETLGHIETARSHLSQIDGETTKAEQGAAAAQSNIFRLEERLTELKKRYTQNEYDVSKALEEANAADQLAKEADKGAKLLESRFEKADSVLKEKETVSGNVKEQAERLKAKAMKLAEDASVKFSTLREIDDEFDENEKKLLDYSKTIEDLNQKMKRYLEEIGTKAEYHRNCNP